jgi:hypothetical protein
MTLLAITPERPTNPLKSATGAAFDRLAASFAASLGWQRVS